MSGHEHGQREHPHEHGQHQHDACATGPQLTSIDEHRERILAEARVLPTHSVVLRDALGLVLAEDVQNRWPVPLFDNSAMDGYAVHRDDAVAGARLRIVADVAAGSAEDPSFGVGEAVRIMTGAPVPSAADAIVPLENTDIGTSISETPPEFITITEQPHASAHIRRKASDAEAGSIAVSAGAELGAWQLSSIAAAGYATISVHRRPRVAVISTGSELIDPAATPARGQIPESNSILLSAALRASGVEVTSSTTVPDDNDALRAAVDEARAVSDAIVLTGGASVGAFDVVKAVLDGTASIRFDRVAMQPGKPQGFGVLDNTLVFCLPGNPVSVAASFEMFVRPALRAMAGHADIDRPRVTRAAAIGWRTPAGRAQILPVIFNDQIVQPASHGGSGSHLVSSLADAEGLAIVAADIDHVDEGDAVTVMVLS
ncbi:molybdopterin molybdotransferase MoeA [Paramicrobacterium chengjingii]|uniref:Molybdopterin molybdenumtransferase n=1 Tax=Paramicrobacterium chengjingii TaxID=2769067 RepID=A0ABX6YG03_9MICO|nr:gephyrin-like molybdotransferase Glp [Microbacterium chengjingii]QPZ37525.1 molybdopterin molybdotransferase MoeA [Microbacterium chengjingii]